MKWFIAHLSTLTPVGAYLWLAGILLLCGLGLPIPEDISLIAAGYFAHRGVLDVHLAFLVCFGAVLFGDAIAFFVGRYLGRRLLMRPFARRYFTPKRQRRVRAYFRKFGSKVVVVGRFTPGFRFSIFFSAGMLHLRPSIFLIYDTAAALVSVPVLVYSAWYFGEHIDRVVEYARTTQHGLLVVALLVAAVLLLKSWHKRRKRRLREAHLASAEPASPAKEPAEAPRRSPEQTMGARPGP